MPAWACFMVFFVFASVGLPGLNGFVGEFLTLLGAFRSGSTLGPVFAATAGLGMIFAAIYLLTMVGKVVWGPVQLPDTHGEAPAGDLNHREIGVLTPLAVGCLVLGLYPAPVLDSLEAPVQKLITPAQVAARSHSLPPAPLGSGPVADRPDTDSETPALSLHLDRRDTHE